MLPTWYCTMPAPNRAAISKSCAWAVAFQRQERSAKGNGGWKASWRRRRREASNRTSKGYGKKGTTRSSSSPSCHLLSKPCVVTDRCWPRGQGSEWAEPPGRQRAGHLCAASCLPWLSDAAVNKDPAQGTLKGFVMGAPWSSSSLGNLGSSN